MDVVEEDKVEFVDEVEDVDEMVEEFSIVEQEPTSPTVKIVNFLTGSIPDQIFENKKKISVA